MEPAFHATLDPTKEVEVRAAVSEQSPDLRGHFTSGFLPPSPPPHPPVWERELTAVTIVPYLPLGGCFLSLNRAWQHTEGNF